MKLVWLSLVLSTAGEGVSNSSKSETYAQRAISSWQAKRDQKKKEKEAERDLRRAKRKNERKNKSRNKTKPSDFVTFTDSPLTSPLPSGEGSKSNSNHLNDPRPSDSEYIPNYMSHDEDDILYTPSYAMFMAKSGADISDIPIEAGDKKKRSRSRHPRHHQPLGQVHQRKKRQVPGALCFRAKIRRLGSKSRRRRIRAYPN